MQKNKLLIIHHTAVSRDIQPSQFYSVGRYHRRKWNMRSRTGYYHGYTHYLGTNGVITQTRYLDEEGAHTLKYNQSGNIAICLAGDFNIELPNKIQQKSLKKFIDDNREFKVVFHRELTENRTCPGNLITREWFNNNLLNSSRDDSDIVDTEKRKEIQKLNKILDGLREIMLLLINKLNKIKK